MDEETIAPAADETEPLTGEFASSQAMESAALAGAAAVQRLVAECNTLRLRVGQQEQELVRLRGTNENVRRRFAMLHQRYVELAKKILGQLEQFDALIRETGQEAVNEASRHDHPRQDEPIVLDQPAHEANGSTTPKSNGRDIAGILAQPPRAPSR
jgi:hypothetical protein